MRVGIRGKVLGPKYNKMRTLLVRGENKGLENVLNFFFVSCNVHYKTNKIHIS